MQETLLKSFRGIERLRAGPGVKAWLLQILRYTWLDRVRSATGRPAEVSLGELPGDPAVQTPSTGSEIEWWGDPKAVLEAFSDKQIIDALRELPEGIRWTLLLVDVEGLSVQETADVLNVPAGTIKSRAHRGRGMLREKTPAAGQGTEAAPGAANDVSSRSEES